MIAVWMTYSILISAVLGAAAFLAERVSLSARLRVRWVWVAALAGSIAIPVSGWLGAGAHPAEAHGASTVETQVSLDPVGQVVSGPSVTNVPGRWMAEGRALVLGVASSASFPHLDAPLLGLWLLASSLLLARLAATHLRLRRRRASWLRRTLDGAPVLISLDEGPGVVGFRGGEVVVPRWALGAGPGTLDCILRHEREHLRAGDHRLTLPVAVTLCLLPWNLPLWWQAGRLRHAVELDCDARVLRGGARPETYGAALMEVAARRSPHTALAAGFAGSPGLGDLERRVRALVPSKRGARGPRLVVQSALSCIGVLVALGVPAPAHTAVLVEGPVIAPMDAGSSPDTLDTQVATPSLAQLRDPPQDLPQDMPGQLQQEPTRRGIRVDRDGRIDWGEDLLGPLIVIDGVIVGETPPDLEATDIASIEVIRGAAAVRLYGSRAEDGVILITTKASDRAVAPEPAGIRVGQDREVVWGQSLAGVLILVDGEVSDAEAVRGLDAGEIRSIEVVRGTAAVRLYGSRGENGVILVTTGRTEPG